MKKFIEKLTKKLYENVKSKSCPDEACWAHLNKNCDNCDSKEIEVTDVIRIANELAEEYNGGWIPCSELPEENGMYLCTVFHADDYVVWIMRFNDGEFLKPDDVEDWNYELLAWMPIAPYQPKGE